MRWDVCVCACVRARRTGGRSGLVMESFVLMSCATEFLPTVAHQVATRSAYTPPTWTNTPDEITHMRSRSIRFFFLTVWSRISVLCTCTRGGRREFEAAHMFCRPGSGSGSGTCTCTCTCAHAGGAGGRAPGTETCASASTASCCSCASPHAAAAASTATAARRPRHTHSARAPRRGPRARARAQARALARWAGPAAPPHTPPGAAPCSALPSPQSSGARQHTARTAAPNEMEAVLASLRHPRPCSAPSSSSRSPPWCASRGAASCARCCGAAPSRRGRACAALRLEDRRAVRDRCAETECG